VNRQTLFILAFFLLAAILVGAIFRYPLVTDDPYITYRYAQNLAAGNGFVFNAGERVLSTTTPLYALLLALFGVLRVDIPAVGYWLSVVSYGAAAFWLYVLARVARRRTHHDRHIERSELSQAVRYDHSLSTQPPWGGIVAGALLLVAPALVMTFGLETGFDLLLGLAALHAYLSNRVTLAFALCALLTLTRNDGVILTGLLALDLLWRQRAVLRHPPAAIRHPPSEILRPFLVYLLILFPWLVFAWLYFGSPFPFTLAAKIAQAQSGLWDPFAIGFFKWVRDNALWLAPLFGFALIGIVGAIRVKTRVLLLLAWAVLHLVAYSILGVAFYPWYIAPLIPALCLFAGIGVAFYPWYIAPLIPALCLFAGIGVAQMAEPRFVARYAVLKYGVMILCALFLVGMETRAALDAGMTKPSPKVEAYQRAAEWLAQHTDAHAMVDALEIGVIGYFDARRTVDFVGLVDPPRVPYLRAQKFADGVRRAHADYVIMIPPDTWLPNDVWFKDAYRPVKQIRVSGFYGGKPLVIYQRADVGRAPIEQIALNAAFEKRIRLQSVELFTRTITRGDVLPLRLNLRALDKNAIPEHWKFTAQLVGAENHIVAQTDNFYPARLPEDEKPFADYQGIPIPRNATAGTYALILAMYDVHANERLSFYDANGNEAGDFLNLGNIEILP
jgi:hypothetical protein